MAPVWATVFGREAARRLRVAPLLLMQMLQVMATLRFRNCLLRQREQWVTAVTGLSMWTVVMVVMAGLRRLDPLMVTRRAKAMVVRVILAVVREERMLYLGEGGEDLGLPRRDRQC